MNLTEFIGRFHPLLVHLPIGILIMAVVFDLLSMKARFKHLLPSVVWLYAFGALSGVVAGITGYLLSLSGDYEAQAVDYHKWFGIGLTVIAIMVFALKYYNQAIPKPWNSMASLIILILVTFTGHLGGNLTHGADFLTKSMPQPFKGWLTGDYERQQIVIENVQEAKVYQDIIVPVLKNKCYGCHGRSKKKGKLRLDSHEQIMKGGESGDPVILPNDPTNSEMIRRAMLPPNNDEHMPPKEKPQLTSKEIKLISWWIEHGGVTDKYVKELPQTETILPLLLSLENGQMANESEDVLNGSIFPGYLPDDKNVPSPNLEAIYQLREKGVIVLPSGNKSPFLEVNFINVDSINIDVIKLLAPLTKNVVRLKLSHAMLNQDCINLIAKMNNLLRLYLDHSTLKDEGLKKLSVLDNLIYLNLVNTSISTKGIRHLSEMPSLEKIYAYGCQVDLSQLKDLQFKVEIGTTAINKMNVDSLKEIPVK